MWKKLNSKLVLVFAAGSNLYTVKEHLVRNCVAFPGQLFQQYHGQPAASIGFSAQQFDEWCITCNREHIFGYRNCSKLVSLFRTLGGSWHR